ncbi:hypothetical protein E6P09_04250 [Haloferax mediterranei ATCC 33500]|uniref:DUF8080 domain-containing protein n=1 Tax=Haloferax mediterranei (strain ATCC 33500 / DSM 1411 / JCM 8866 / NBRC 14739 / NCIMB 2177 / R-4) TaxID=523841 RepID=I3R160_HALMT|nr:hypothetical protein [Haloferax mediterranei]AFK17970.1 hypothetical protein HFX_0229 [Haloferax mediterranei ATCC 33500]AHZ22609.1 hypothetical protein BM92_08115 [Haloferax mediterranei ATCC 33500]EMA02753.1 hypothetical protein C439_09230 [Haloferax mediterranei ATCC 33500]MDX5988062.1 hypothetical protein [Haloferax mediterranei ATCC 33500]QCQ74521.1 hypothetical protein E6P09_04250 [Haloferax mediterranei ATCC 33500]
MHSDVDVTVVDDVVLVTVRFDNAAPVDQRVRLQNRLDGPVLPPRRAGVPAPGWDDDGFEGVVPAESTVALGYACPLSPSGPDLSGDVDPATVVDIDVLGRADETDEQDRSTAADAIRELGASRPPADAVPAPTSESPSTADSTVVPESEASVRGPTDADVAAAVADTHGEGESDCSESETVGPSAPSATPPAVDAAQIDSDATADPIPTAPDADQHLDSSFLAAVARRIELAEQLDGASVDAAATALSTSDASIEDVESLDADRAQLRRLAERATTLADRAADADPDIEALRRLA